MSEISDQIRQLIDEFEPPETGKKSTVIVDDDRTKVIVFAHQRLDVSNNHGVKTNSQVRSVLESSGKVLAVFQGHSHQNDVNEIGGIHYCTLVAMVEGSGKKTVGTL